MARNPFRLFRLPNTFKDDDLKHVRTVLDTIERGRAILKVPSPGTFVGQKSQEPFPKEEEE